MSDDELNMFNNELELADKRAAHNALEQRRRSLIKDSFSSLRDSVPTLKEEKSASRAKILKKATDYIKLMKSKNLSHKQDIDDLKRQNNILELQIRKLERVKSTRNSAMESRELALDLSESENSDA